MRLLLFRKNLFKSCDENKLCEGRLQYLASMSQIAQVLGVFHMTIYRRRVEYGMLNYASRNITDEELHVVIDQIRRELPTLGETMMWGHLRSMHGILCFERESSVCY